MRALYTVLQAHGGCEGLFARRWSCRLRVNGDGWCLRSSALVGVSLAGGFAVAGGGLGERDGSLGAAVVTHVVRRSSAVSRPGSQQHLLCYLKGIAY